MKIPDLETVKTAIAGGAAVWLFVGFYDYDAKTDEYAIISHHYAALLGFDEDRHGVEDEGILFVHDPAPRAITKRLCFK